MEQNESVLMKKDALQIKIDIYKNLGNRNFRGFIAFRYLFYNRKRSVHNILVSNMGIDSDIL